MSTLVSEQMYCDDCSPDQVSPQTNYTLRNSIIPNTQSTFQQVLAVRSLTFWPEHQYINTTNYLCNVATSKAFDLFSGMYKQFTDVSLVDINTSKSCSLSKGFELSTDGISTHSSATRLGAIGPLFTVLLMLMFLSE
ncbi:hypothetical protein PROFUN_03304 [Planoprotostelium fungivorum]|uniref:Uncharacterized protein n=1 Tax=Planoprotostelium fungivorum TaxID=1890364 RepID=A0A2P6NWQ6_9EUKA|nr:hypothetical protein PROFUN_03304 [Planoprotostelium fungivorum]